MLLQKTPPKTPVVPRKKKKLAVALPTSTLNGKGAHSSVAQKVVTSVTSDQQPTPPPTSTTTS